MTTDQKLAEALKLRAEIQANVQRLKGKLESAKASLATVEKDCRDRKIDPDNIDQVIERLEVNYTEAVDKIADQVAAANAALAPFLNA